MQATAISLSEKKTSVFNSLKRNLSLFILKLIRPYGIGDYIKVNGMEGFVEDISFSETIIKTIKSNRITLSNQDIDLNWAFKLATVKISSRSRL